MADAVTTFPSSDTQYPTVSHFYNVTSFSSLTILIAGSFGTLLHIHADADDLDEGEDAEEIATTAATVLPICCS